MKPAATPTLTTSDNAEGNLGWGDYFVRLSEDPRLAYTSLALVGLAFILPVLHPFRLSPIPAFYGDWLTFVLSLGALAPALFRTATWRDFTVPKTTLYLLGFAGVALIPALLRPNHPYHTLPLLFFLFLGLAIALSWLAGWLRERLSAETVVHAMALFLLVGGLLQAMIGIAQFLGRAPDALHGWLAFWPDDSVSGHLGQRNHFASYLVLTVGALIYLYAVGRVSRFVTGSLLFLLAFMLTLSASRSVWLFLAATMLLSGIAYRQNRDPATRRLVYGGAAAIGLFLLGQILFPYMVYALRDWIDPERFTQITAMQRLGDVTGYKLRLYELHKAWLAFLTAPFFGVGVGNYGWYSFFYRDIAGTAAGAIFFHHAHNVFAEVLAEFGLAGTLVLIALMVTWIIRFFRSELSPARWLIAVFLSVLAIHSLLEYPLWYAYFLAIAAFMLGLGDTRASQVRVPPALGLTLAFGLLVAGGAMLANSVIGYGKLRMANTLILKSPKEALKILEPISKDMILRPWVEANVAFYLVPNPALITAQVKFTERVMRFRPEPMFVYKHVAFLAVAQRHSEAAALLQRAVTGYPTELPKYYCQWRAMSYPGMETLLAQARTYPSAPPECPLARVPQGNLQK